MPNMPTTNFDFVDARNFQDFDFIDATSNSFSEAKSIIFAQIKRQRVAEDLHFLNSNTRLRRPPKGGPSHRFFTLEVQICFFKINTALISKFLQKGTCSGKTLT